MKLVQLIYLSELIGRDETSLGPILSASVRRNLEASVTGMLLYSQGTFLQMLEGEEGAVNATYQRIEQDPRHHRLVLLSVEPVAQREFDRWSMGFRHLSHADAQHLPRMAPWFRFGFSADALNAAPRIARDMLAFFNPQAN
jgi:hypothetical protein